MAQLLPLLVLEYLSQTKNSKDFTSDELKFKFIDDLSFLEILNLLSQGLCSFNMKFHVLSNIGSEHNQYLPPENFNPIGDNKRKIRLINGYGPQEGDDKKN